MTDDEIESGADHWVERKFLDYAEQERDALRAEVERLREALRFYATEWVDDVDGDPRSDPDARGVTEPSDILLKDHGRRARAALAGQQEDER